MSPPPDTKAAAALELDGTTQQPSYTTTKGSAANCSLPRLTYSVVEAAAVSGCSPSLIYRLAAQGAIPGVIRIGQRRIVFSRQRFDDWLNTGAEVLQ